MNIKTLALLGLPVMLLGCPTGDSDDTDIPVETGDTDVDTDDTDDTDTDPPPALAVTVTPGAANWTIAIANGTESYDFGWMQTAVKEGGGDGWSGEDCYLGEATFNYCHPVGQTGATLTLTDINSIVEGTSTIMPVDSPPLTYILIGATSGDCWVWGDDPTYYDAFPGGPCTAL